MIRGLLERGLRVSRVYAQVDVGIASIAAGFMQYLMELYFLPT